MGVQGEISPRLYSCERNKEWHHEEIHGWQPDSVDMEKPFHYVKIFHKHKLNINSLNSETELVT